MNRLRIFVGVMIFAALLLPCAGQANCTHARVQANVEVGDGRLSLADLLAADSCPSLRRAALRVPLGHAPRLGSIRVFEGEQVRQLVRELALGEAGSARPSVAVPARVTVRQAGMRASCGEIAEFLSGAFSPPQPAGKSGLVWPAGLAAEDLLTGLDCGGAGSLAQAALLELSKVSWKPAQSMWEFLLRCVRPEDCVPFLVRSRGRLDSTTAASLWFGEATGPPSNPGARSQFLAQRPQLRANRPDPRPILVRPGQTSTLLWEQSGIRISLEATCLDAGSAGDQVRVRTRGGNRILHAEVGSDGTMRITP